MNRYDIAKGKKPFSDIEMDAIPCAKKGECGVDCDKVFGFCLAMEHAYQPWTLDEATSYLYGVYRSMNSDSASKVNTMAEHEFVIHQHPYLGDGLKHQWRLESDDSHLVLYFKSVGVHSADDMIVILLVSLYRRIKGKKRDLPTLIREYGSFWDTRRILLS